MYVIVKILGDFGWSGPRNTNTSKTTQRNIVEFKTHLKPIHHKPLFPQDEKQGAEEEIEKSDDIKPEENLLVSKRTTLEERRKSLLDTHWAIPSRDR